MDRRGRPDEWIWLAPDLLAGFGILPIVQEDTKKPAPKRRFFLAYCLNYLAAGAAGAAASAAGAAGAAGAAPSAAGAAGAAAGASAAGAAGAGASTLGASAGAGAGASSFLPQAVKVRASRAASSTECFIIVPFNQIK